MPQFLRPTSDVDAGTWLAHDGGVLYATLDESSPPVDTDFIYTLSAGTCKVGLGAGTDPASSSDHIVRYRAAGDGATNIIVTLYDVSTSPITQVAQWTESSAAEATTLYEHTLSGGEADAITDYSALELWFEAAAGGASIAERAGVKTSEAYWDTAVTARNLTFAAPVSTGDLLIIVGTVYGQDAVTLVASDNQGNSWTELWANSGNANVFICYAISAGNNTPQVTITCGASLTGWTWGIDAFTGISATPLDVDGGLSVDVSTAPADDITTVASDTLVIANEIDVGVLDDALTSNDGTEIFNFTDGTTYLRGAAVFDILSSAQTKTYDWTIGSNIGWVVKTASFKAA